MTPAGHCRPVDISEPRQFVGRLPYYGDVGCMHTFNTTQIYFAIAPDTSTQTLSPYGLQQMGHVDC
jgi:hypothetical protein